MKNENKMKKVMHFNKYSISAMLMAGVLFTGCKDDDDVAPPKEENPEEVITDVKLIFTNASDAKDIVTVSAIDPDGNGVKELTILDSINLKANTTYNLTFDIKALNEDITEEIEEEDDEHQFFFAFTKDVFSNPLGDGNIDKASDPINYSDKDDNNVPVGLKTSWTTSGSALSKGVFTARLQHQPDIKKATTGATDGDTDFELSFVLNIIAPAKLEVVETK